MAMTEQQPLGELFSELASNTGTLVRKEVELAAVEMTAKARTAGRNAALVVAGCAVAMLGAIALLAALILGLGTFMPLWLAALLVGVVVAGSGGGLALSAFKAFKAIDVAPRQTIETLEENKQWLKNQASR
jgi:ureidoglycolate hydrolase